VLEVAAAFRQKLPFNIVAPPRAEA
jgi:hypothetical protein